MEVFKRMDEAFAITKHAKGKYRQLPLYHREDKVFVKVGQSFVMIRYWIEHEECWATSDPDICVLDMDFFKFYQEKVAGQKNIRFGEKK